MYHKYAKCKPFDDVWSRLHVHGLNYSFLLTHGLKNEDELICDFKLWLENFNVQVIYVNDVSKESKKLNLSLRDIGLPCWIERVKHSYHRIPQLYKNSDKSFCNINCNSNIHSYYKYKNLDDITKPVDRVKAEHGFHCSLADVYEFHLFSTKRI